MGLKFQLWHYENRKMCQKALLVRREWMLHTITGSSVACTLLDTCMMSACMPESACNVVDRVLLESIKPTEFSCGALSHLRTA